MDKHDQNDGILASIQFRGFRFNRIKFKNNDQFPVGKSVDLSYDFDHIVQLNPDDNSAVVILRTTIFPGMTEGEASFPFSLDTEMIGYFTYDAQLGEKERDVLFEENAVAIMLPYVRSAITMVTTSAGVAPLLLPLINVIEYLRAKKRAT